MPLATRFALTMTLVIVLLVAGISLTLIQSERSRLQTEMENQATTLVESITLGLNSASLLERRSLLVDYFDQLIPASHGQILYGLITGLNNFAWLNTRHEHEYETLTDPVSEQIRQKLEKSPRTMFHYRHPELKEEVLEVASRITGNGMDRGILRVGFSLKPLQEKIGRAILHALLIGLIALTGGIGLSLWFARGVAQPIGRVVAYARQVAQGGLTATLTERSKTREMAELAQSIESMKRDLKYIYIGGLFRDFSHAIKSDLGYLYSELERLAAEGKERLVVRPLVERLDRIGHEIQKFKEFQKPTDVRKESFDPSPFFREFVQKLPTELKGRVVLELPEKLPPIFVDATYLNRALTHLVKNAYEATAGLPTAAPITLKAFAERRQLFIQVSDKGAGIEAMLLPRLFEPGFSTKRGEGGEGLGLALTQMIVEDLHGGQVKIESKKGHGTLVTVVLPC